MSTETEPKARSPILVSLLISTLLLVVFLGALLARNILQRNNPVAALDPNYYGWLETLAFVVGIPGAITATVAGVIYFYRVFRDMA